MHKHTTRQKDLLNLKEIRDIWINNIKQSIHT